jgi:hypothetical protein
MASKKSAIRKSAPAKKPAAANSRKVAHLKDMPIDAWLAQRTSGWQRELITQMLGVAQRAAPKVTVAIKWGQPVLSLGRPFAFIRQAKAHVTFGLWQGIEVKDPAGLLQVDGARTRQLTLTSADALDAKRFAALIREVAERAAE